MNEINRFKPELEKIIRLIHFALNVDAAVFDTGSRIVSCSEEYLRQKGRTVHKPSIEEVIANDNIVVNSPGHMPTCKGCRFIGDCPAKIEILKSIRKNGVLFGVLAFTSFSKKGHNRITNDTGRFSDALNYFSDWIGQLLHSRTQMEKLAETSDILTTFMDQSEEGMLVIDAQGSVVLANSQAQDLFAFCDLYTRSAYHILPDSIVDKALEANRLKKMQIKLNNQPAYISAAPVRSGDDLKFSVLSIQEKKHLLNPAASKKKERFKANIDPDQYIESILGQSRKIKNLKSLIRRIKKSQSTVLISGETGTGKGLLAKVIHQTGTRSGGPFVTLNCTSIPETLFESELFGYEEGAFTGAKKGGKPGMLELAQGGTLFLDEIGEMPLHMQAKLLNVLQDYEFQRVGGVTPIFIDVRIIAATNQDLTRRVEEKNFRADLFYRLNVIPILLPPLRDRENDLEMIARAFLADANQKAGTKISAISDPVMQILKAHTWPGNIRELHNTIEYCINLEESDELTIKSLPEHLFPPSDDTRENRRHLEKEAPSSSIRHTVIATEGETILKCLDEYGYDLNGKKQTAAHLGISLRTLYRKLEKYKIIQPVN